MQIVWNNNKVLYVENGCYNYSKCYNKNHVRVTWKFLGGGGSSKTPLERKFLRGGGMQTKNLPWEGYGYFLEPHIAKKCIKQQSGTFVSSIHIPVLGFLATKGPVF